MGMRHDIRVWESSLIPYLDRDRHVTDPLRFGTKVMDQTMRRAGNGPLDS